MSVLLRKMAMLASISAMAVLAPEALAQQVTVANESSNYGFIAFFKNAEGVALYLVGTVMTLFAVAGVIIAYFAAMTFKDNVSDSPQSGQPEWGKFLGQLVLVAAFLGGSGWIYSITSALHGTDVKSGAGQVVRDRYQGTGTPR